MLRYKKDLEHQIKQEKNLEVSEKVFIFAV
jgi:hypothetical protein